MVKFNLHSLRLTFLPCFFFEIFCPLVRGACYYPNGTDMNEFYDFPVKANYSPCNFSSEHVMCCAQWDSCRSDGLCFNKQDSNKEVWRDGCTDPTWKSPSCIKLCLDGFLNSTTMVTPCKNGSYCCGISTEADNCCEVGLGFYLVNGEAVKDDPIGFRSSSRSETSSAYFSSSTSSLTASSPPRASSSPTASSFSKILDDSTTTPIVESLSPTSASSSAPRPSERVGVLVGGVVGGVSILCLILITGMVLIRRRRKHQDLNSPQIHATSSYPERTLERFEVPGCNGSNELHATSRLPPELCDVRMRQELP